MFKKKLIALDFSGPSMELFNFLTDLRRMGLEELLLVHVIRVELGAGDGIHPVQIKFLENIRSKTSGSRAEHGHDPYRFYR
jgi:hypothetical protein